MQFTISTLALLSGLVSAAPTNIARGTGTTFNLLFTGVGTAPEPVDSLNSGTWVVASRRNRAELVSDRAQANLFYKYGSDFHIGTASTGIVITPGGTATVPSGAPVELVNNNGTAGVDILLNDSGLPTLWYEDGRFQACADSDGIFLSYIQPGQRQLADCAAVELVSVCSSTGVGSPLTGQLGQPITVSCQSN
ncbi:hypothetical protein K458DRAFT_417426 [Lentithecium fluviatile CBS 122367]|uniref:DUF7907 domain-containing protein n=1 Tax=Lentithecium fluviatile CBS 122367 TaxID=1168545 RepID=A0A6G1J4C2_9PLEO|nr:hypothetical protein K458DRAFT_417426 [Lentithecium fluviatile CBS 122367]